MQPRKAVILTADAFEDMELFVPYYRLLEDGIAVDVAAPKADKIRGEHGYSLKANMTIDQVDPDHYGLLIIPGGFPDGAPATVRRLPKAQAIAKSFFAANKPVASICHGPWLLVSAGLVSGRRLTSYWHDGVPEEITAAGGIYEDKEVVVDGNLVTSRWPLDLPAFTREMMRSIAVAAFVVCAALCSAAPLTAQHRHDVAGLPARPTAAWVRDAVIYELNTRTFSREGTFNAVTDRLPELQKLGVTILWLMPIHPIGQEKKKGTVGSPYAVRDYMEVSPEFGTKADLRRLVVEAHRLGLKVIIDIVANHTSWDNVLLKTPAYYRRDAAGQVLSPYDWTDVAALNYTNPALRKYMNGMLQYWLREFDLDGFRCDVAGEVPVDFWEDARRDLEKIKPDIVMLAESHEPDLLVKAFDLDYGWPGYHAMKDAILGNRGARAVREDWESERRDYPRGALHMRMSDDHDERRAIAFFGERAALAASALVFTMDGVPLLYNGMEAGDVTESGAPELFENLPVYWANRERRPDFPAFYQRMIPLRREHSALRQGTTTWLHNADEDRVVTFVRRDDREDVLVAVNLSNRPFSGTVELAGANFAEITPGASAPGAPALPALSLDAWGVRLFRRPRTP